MSLPLGYVQLDAKVYSKDESDALFGEKQVQIDAEKARVDQIEEALDDILSGDIPQPGDVIPGSNIKIVVVNEDNGSQSIAVTQ